MKIFSNKSSKNSTQRAKKGKTPVQAPKILSKKLGRAKEKKAAPVKKKAQQIDDDLFGDFDAPIPMLTKSRSVLPFASNRGLGMLDAPSLMDDDTISTAPTSKSKKSGV